MTAKVVEYARMKRKRLAETARWLRDCARPRATCGGSGGRDGGNDRPVGAAGETGGTDGAGVEAAGVEGVTACDIPWIRAC
jgi:hypothetical protein